MEYINYNELKNQIDLIDFAKDIGIKLEQYNDTYEYRGFCRFKKHNSATLFINREKPSMVQ